MIGPDLMRGAMPVDISWHARAACGGEDERRFFRPEYVQEAKAICAGCDVRDACLNDARTRREPYGVWGGEDEDERKVWLRNNARRRAHAAQQAAPEHKPRGPRITDHTPCAGCGRVMRTRAPGRSRREHIGADEVFHRGGGRCDTCWRLQDGTSIEFRWAITDLGIDMSLAQLTQEAIDTGRLDDAARERGVQLLLPPGQMRWRLDAERGQLVATGPARALEVAA